MSNLLRDLRYGMRALMRDQAFAAVAVLSIGIGIGANTTVFSWMRSMVLNPLPGAVEPERIVAIENLAADREPLTTSYLDFTDFRDRLRTVSQVTARIGNVFAVGEGANSSRVWGEMVSGNFFDLLGLSPEAGRFYLGAERDDTQNAHPVVIISHAYWKNHYHLDASAIGSTLRVNDTVLTIIGVTPAGFHGTRSGFDYEMWMPLTMYGKLTHTGTWMLRDRNTRNFQLLARLAPGASLEQAREEVEALANRMAVLDADTNQGVGATVLPVWQSHFGTQSVLLTPIATLMGVSGVVLLIVCANLANLLLARATGRQKEFSIRLALGAAPGRLAGQILTETLLLASAGAVCGLLFARMLGGAIGWLLPAVARPTLLEPPLDGQVFVYTTGLAFLVVLLSGLLPAIEATRANVNEGLKQGGRSGGSGAHSQRLRGLLVSSEVALAVIALVGAGLFLKSFETARTIDPGFSPNGVALARFDSRRRTITRSRTTCSANDFVSASSSSLESPKSATTIPRRSASAGETGRTWRWKATPPAPVKT